MPDSFSMNFFLAFSAERFYGIMGTKGICTSTKFIHFLFKVFKDAQKIMFKEE